MTLLSGWPLEIGVDDILRGQGMDPQIVRSGKPMLAAAAERARHGGTKTHPSGCHAS